MSRDRRSRAALSAVLASMALLLSGCLSLGESAKISVYSPDITVAPHSDWPQAEWSLLLMRPLASASLDSPRIAVRPGPGLLQVYQGAVWSDPVPDLLQTAVLRALEDSGRILAVARQGSGLRGDATLQLDVRRFESVYAAPKSAPTVTIEVQAKLFGGPGQRVLAAKTFRSDVAADDKELPAVTQAFESATTKLVAELVGWTLKSGPAPAKP